MRIMDYVKCPKCGKKGFREYSPCGERVYSPLTYGCKYCNYEIYDTKEALEYINSQENETKNRSKRQQKR